MSKAFSEYMNTKDEIVLESAVTQISTNSVEAARKLSATVAGKFKKRICDENFINPIERMKKQRTESSSVIPEVTNKDRCTIVIITDNCRKERKIEEQFSLPILQEK